MILRLPVCRAMAILVAATALLLAIDASARPSGPAGGAAQRIGCATDPLGAAGGWNVIVHGDLEQQRTDSEGRVAVGGNATLGSYGVASSLPVDPDRVDLVVGGDLAATDVGVNREASRTAAR